MHSTIGVENGFGVLLDQETNKQWKGGMGNEDKANYFYVVVLVLASLLMVSAAAAATIWVKLNVRSLGWVPLQTGTSCISRTPQLLRDSGTGGSC
jgi:hypothetical protein